MAVITKDLGPVSAYAVAVANGYEGTEAEWSQLQMTSAQNSQIALNAKTAAETAATNASGSATAAANSASAASGSATAAANSATAAAGSATSAQNAKTAAQAAQAAAEAAQSVVETIEASIPEDYSDMSDDVATLKEQIVTKAEIDGYYEAMTVGNAEQLVATVGVEDNAPYTFRTAGGSADIGDRLAEKLVGGTICWNQLMMNPTSMGGSIKSVPEGIDIGANHKYLVRFDCSITDPSVATKLYMYGRTQSNTTFLQNQILNLNGGQRETIVNVSETFTTTGDPNAANSMWFYNTAANNTTVKSINLFDLTKMFGSEIADYIYGLEQANAGNGVAWFRKYFPKPYYAYDPGSLQSVNVAAHKTTEFNQWDEEWELGGIGSNGDLSQVNDRIRTKDYIQVIPGTTYYRCSPSNTQLFFYDANKSFISSSVWGKNATFVTPDTAGFMKFIVDPAYGTTYKNDICINLSWDGERDGEYEPYAEHVYPLDSSVQLRGMWKLDENNDLYFYGDEYLSDGSVLRRFAEVDLGTLTWSKQYEDGSDYGWFQASTAIPLAKESANGEQHLINSLGGSEYAFNSSTSLTESRIGVSGTGSIRISLSPRYVDLTTEQFKTQMDGQSLVYELATPVIEQAEPYAANQLVNDFGTEEYIDAGVEAQTRDVSIPVGHETSYQANLRAKLEMAPNSPDGDGLYAVRQTNSTNEYVNIAPTLNAKANIDGDYDTLTAGQARQLVATVGVEDNAPYNFRTAGGSADIGDRLVDKLVGGTIAWNQLFKKGTINYTSTKCNVQSDNDGKWTVTINTDDANAGEGNLFWLTCPFVENHKYYISSGNSIVKINLKTNPYPTNNGLFYARSNTASCNVSIVYPENSVGTYTLYPQLFDLTQMFGSTIADYIYSLEQATAGAGVAWFKKWFPKPYYAYNPGELMSVQAASHKTVGFNAYSWDKYPFIEANGNSAWKIDGYIPIVAGQTYEFNQNIILAGHYIDWFNSDKAYISTSTLYGGTYVQGIAPVNASFAQLRVYHPDGVSEAGLQNSETCFHLVWDGERDGEYEPYVEHVYPLDDSLTLRGIPKLDSSNNLYYDGDTYESDGTVTRRYGVVDLGTLTWYYQPNSSTPRFNASIGAIANDGSPYWCTDIVCSRYTKRVNVGQSEGQEKVIGVTVGKTANSQVYLADTMYTDVSTLRAALSGVLLLYPLATPTTETAEPFQNPQVVDDFGTEEYVDAGVVAETRDVAIPVGHETTYQANLRAKLEMAPDSPDGNGDYIVRHVDGMNSYVPISFPADELPAAPTDNGNYHLKCTVADGTVTYTWEADT